MCDLVSARSGGQSALKRSPVTIQTARAFVGWTQHHLTPPASAVFAIGAQNGDGTLVGAALNNQSLRGATPQCWMNNLPLRCRVAKCGPTLLKSR